VAVVKWFTRDKIVGLLLVCAWSFFIIWTAAVDLIPAITETANEENTLEAATSKAMAAVYNLFPWFSEEFRALGSVIGIVVTFIGVKTAALTPEESKSVLQHTLIRRAKWGVGILIFIGVFSLVKIPEAALPGEWALLRFWLTAILAICTNVLLSSASGLEIGLLLPRSNSGEGNASLDQR
jgi:hypothetical protein